jgi:hypothetical protein
LSANSPLNSAGYSCEPANLVRDREDILSIWRGTLGNVASRVAKYDWFYIESEAGSPVVSLLRHTETGRRVGVAAAGPRRATWNGRGVRVGVLVDLAVVPEHRSLFPALLLQRSLQQAVPGSLAALYGFPNPRAVPVFTRVGYTRALDVRRFVRVLRSGSYLRRHLPGWAAALLARPLDLLMEAWDAVRTSGPGTHKAGWSTEVDPRVDDLWEVAPHGNGPILVRDASFLRWRFDTKPGPACRYLNVESGDGRLIAWIACEDDGACLVVRDFWSSRGYDGIDPSIVLLLLGEARRGGYSSVSLEFGGSANIIRVFEAAGFSERDRRPFFSYFSSESTPPRDAAWYVTSADEDE